MLQRSAALALACLLGMVAPAEGDKVQCDGALALSKFNSCFNTYDTFARCMDTNSSCECLLTAPGFLSCLGECSKLFLARCVETVHQHPSWKANSSKFLQYTAPQPPELRHVHGMYLIHNPAFPGRRARFYSSSLLRPNTVMEVPTLDPSSLSRQEIDALFSKCDFSNNRDLMASTLNHLYLWQHIASTHNELHLVIEEDVVVDANFKHLWNTKHSLAMPRHADLIYLGGIISSNMWVYKNGEILEPFNDLFNRHRLNTYFQEEHLGPGIDNFTKGPTRRFFYTPSAYLLSSDGAQKLIDFVKAHGFRKAAGHTLYRLMQWSENAAFATNPLLIKLPSPAAAATPPARQDQSPSSPSPIPSQDHGDQMHSFDERGSSPGGSPPASGARTGTGTGSSSGSSSDGSSGHRGAGGASDQRKSHVDHHFRTFVVRGLAPLDASAPSQTLFLPGAALASLEYSEHIPFPDTQPLSLPLLRRKGVLTDSFPDHAQDVAARSLSHLTLLEQLLDESSVAQYLVLEDNTYVPPNFHTALGQLLAALPTGWHVFYLSCPPTCIPSSGPRGPVMPISPKCVVEPQAYLVQRAGAEAILHASVPLRSALEDQIRVGYGTRTSAFCSTVPLVQVPATSSAPATASGQSSRVSIRAHLGGGGARWNTEL